MGLWYRPVRGTFDRNTVLISFMTGNYPLIFGRLSTREFYGLISCVTWTPLSLSRPPAHIPQPVLGFSLICSPIMKNAIEISNTSSIFGRKSLWLSIRYLYLSLLIFQVTIPRAFSIEFPDDALKLNLELCSVLIGEMSLSSSLRWLWFISWYLE